MFRRTPPRWVVYLRAGIAGYALTMLVLLLVLSRAGVLR